MPREWFKSVEFRSDTIALLSQCNQIVGRYMAQGFTLTLRQLFYQLVVQNIIVNSERSYQNLSRVVSNGRLAGIIDWDAIEDRIRVPFTPADWDSPADIMRSVVASYRLPRWANQPYRVELWVEKDALAGVLRPIATRRHVTQVVNRGYSSQSAMHDAYERFTRANMAGKECIVLYLGDLDPSGEDMVRDVRERLNDLFDVRVEVIKLAITPEQVATYNPPPNPAKMSDSRAAGFVALHGRNSYEVDALPPDVLTQLIEDAIEQYEDGELMQEVLDQEETDKELFDEVTAAVMHRRDGENADAN